MQEILSEMTAFAGALWKQLLIFLLVTMSELFSITERNKIPQRPIPSHGHNQNTQTNEQKTKQKNPNQTPNQKTNTPKAKQKPGKKDDVTTVQIM